MPCVAAYLKNRLRKSAAGTCRHISGDPGSLGVKDGRAEADEEHGNENPFKIIIGASASPNTPNKVQVNPKGKAKGHRFFISYYEPIAKGCMTEETIFKEKAIQPSCLKDRPMDFSKTGNMAGIRASNGII